MWRQAGNGGSTILGAYMIETKRLSRSNGRRRGFQTLELIFALPVAMLLLAASFSFGSMLMTRACLTHAVTVAAREAGKGGSVETVVDAVNDVLAANQIAITDERGSGTKIAVQDSGGQFTEYGDPNLSCRPSPFVQPNEVCVTLWIDPSATKSGGLKPVFARFDFLGLCRKGFCLRASVNKEQVGAAKAADGSAITVACR